MQTTVGQPNAVAMVFFFVFIAITLGITYWAARRTKNTEQFYAAGREVSAWQNGFALAGDYMSAASFLGIAGLVATSGFDGLIYSTGWLVGWPIVLFLIAEPLRNLGKFTFADVVAARMTETPVRLSAALGTLCTVILYLIAQMVGAGSLIRLMFGLPYEGAVPSKMRSARFQPQCSRQDVRPNYRLRVGARLILPQKLAARPRDRIGVVRREGLNR